MDKLIILRNTLIGVALAGFFSYIVSMYDTNNNYLKIAAFAWGIPMLFFLLLFIAWNKSDSAGLHFTKHALFGSSITIFTMIITLLLFDLGKLPVVYINFLILFTSLFIYIYFKMYEKF